MCGRGVWVKCRLCRWLGRWRATVLCDEPILRWASGVLWRILAMGMLKGGELGGWGVVELATQ